MKKHPNVGSKVEDTTKFKYAFTLSEFDKYLSDNSKKNNNITEKLFTELSKRYLKRILKGNRTVFKNWIPAPSNDSEILETKMTSLIWFLYEKSNRENLIEMLKSDLTVTVNYDKYHQVTTVDTVSVPYNNLPDNIKKEIDKSIIPLYDFGDAIDTVKIDKDIEKGIEECKKFISTNKNWEEKIIENMCGKELSKKINANSENDTNKHNPDYFDEQGMKLEEKLNKELDAALVTKPATQVSTYWLFGIIPIWIRRKIVTQ